MAYIGKNPRATTWVYTPQSATPSNPVEGMVFRSDGTALSEGLHEYRGGTWIALTTASEANIRMVVTGTLDTFEIIDGYYAPQTGQTLTTVVVTCGDSGSSGTTTATVRRDGTSGTGSVTASLAANSNATDTNATTVSLTGVNGDWFWVDLTSVATGAEDITVELKFT